MNSYQLDEMIRRLKGEIPEAPSWTGLGLVRHEWRPVFDLCKEIQAGFKSGVRYPTRDLQNEAWNRFNELRDLAHKTSTQEREALALRSERHRDDLLYMCRGISYSPVSDIIFFFDKTTAEEVRSWGREVGQVMHAFSDGRMK